MNVEEYNDEMIDLGKDIVKDTVVPFRLKDIESNKVSAFLNSNPFVAPCDRISFVTPRQT